MNKYFSLLLSMSLLLSCKNKPSSAHQAAPTTETFAQISSKTPETRKDTVSSDYFGTTIQDPYRWLEDDHAEETKAWVLSQNKVSFDYLDQIPFRKALRARVEKLFNYEKSSTPIKKAGKYYFFKNNGLQNQDVLYVSDQLKSEARMVIDPNTFSKDGTTSLSSYSFSKDGKYLSFMTSEGGSDWNKIMVKDLVTGNILPDTILWVKFSGAAWQKDGFYYSRYPEPKGTGLLSAKNEYHAVFFHKLGTSQKEDKLIFQDKKFPLRNCYASLTEDERFLVVSGSESTSGNSLGIQDMSKPGSKLQWLVSKFSDDYNVIGNIGDQIFVHTNQNAPNWKVLSFSASSPDIKNWKEVIPEGKDVLQNIGIFGGKLVATFIHDASSTVKIFDLEGKELKKLELPEIGTVGGFSGDQDDDEAFYSFSSFIRPNTIYRYDMKSMTSEVFFSPKLEFNPDEYKTEQVWYTSKDGTKVPMFLTSKKSLVKNGNAPTLLYAYGGFDISVLPSFSITRVPIIENDGIYAVANIRGGGEFGKEWHQSGTLARKQNVFDDFIGAADFLVAEKYTSRDRLAIEGRSNGGLLIGACITQRPDLCKVAFPAVGVLDMLRYHKFTIGWAWATDYGTSETKEGFDYLIKYSPVHNARPAQYPATMICTADHDDRVVPAHSFKFAAAMQAAQHGENPMLIRIDVSAGHGAGKPTSKRIDEAADLLSFMFYNFKIKPNIN
ncbi:MAG: prolyl oligopeptidase family serine peptidase [Saprospiraceae bacterium]